MLEENDLTGGEYIEPYAGGSGIALSLLVNGDVSRIHINDLNSRVFAFWRSVFQQPDELCKLIRDTRVTIRSWRRQRNIFNMPSNYTDLEIGFATFFLNRTNRSGILTGGVIGGLNQKGKWKIDARYNKTSLCLKIERIATYANQVFIYNIDAETFLANLAPTLPRKSLIMLDPPYYRKSQRLYQDLYSCDDHARIADNVAKLRVPWIISYDDEPEVRKLYRSFRNRTYGLLYSAAEKYVGTEILFFSPKLKLPRGSSPTLD
jgi:DNA adenine methylase